MISHSSGVCRPSTYLPANLHSRVHNKVRVLGRLALSLALLLPELLHRKHSQLSYVRGCRSSLSVRRLTMMASEEPIVEVPMVFASSWEGALNSLAIIETHPALSQLPFFLSLYGSGRTVLDIGADGVLFVVDEVLGEGVTSRVSNSKHPLR